MEFTSKFKAFAGEGARKHKILVDLEDQTVMVWDPVGLHFTNVNSMSDGTKKRLLQQAKFLSK